MQRSVHFVVQKKLRINVWEKCAGENETRAKCPFYVVWRTSRLGKTSPALWPTEETEKGEVWYGVLTQIW